ncbi:E3 ubiquitin-protein ligase TRIM35-like [Corythoichthys intestinalis]|uniref:E3 ubiquitin-protein ligase TRIM35-like n=1 Tax=Corythoichthys intestinalis TaxID=161448 RepID=UPI0025A4E168|nr:E3 ubiquitin-protein ligase TRIM35-like [Corythoichthys intestinalis]
MAGRLEQHLQCPTCLDVFKDPVMLPCSHSYCRACLQQWKDKGERSCPLCRTEFQSTDPPLNLALRNMCENFLNQVWSEDTCCLHDEKLKLFCLEDQELVCLICRDSKIHAGHKFRPLKEVAEDHKEELQCELQRAKNRLEDYTKVRENCIELAEYIKVQSEKIENKIKKDFEELRRFLDVEEKARLAAVMEEEKIKSQFMKEKIAALSRDMATLSHFIRRTEENLASDDIAFMKNILTAMSRYQEPLDELKLPGGVLLDEAKHVGNLKFNIWERMKESLSYSPVILDPNTAGPGLILSEDLTSLTLNEANQPPENPERSKAKIVLGCALDSGTNIWDVEVGDNNDWCLGVQWGDPCLPARMVGFFFGFKDEPFRMARPVR